VAPILRNLRTFLENQKKVTLNIDPRMAWLLVDVLGYSLVPVLRLCAYPDLSFSSAYNDNSTIRSSS
jgi:hypothetical protein